MATEKGNDIVTCYHPDRSEIYCEIDVEWKFYSEPAVMYYRDGSGYPGCTEFEITKSKLLTYCDEAVTPNEPLPEWIDWNRVTEDIATYNQL